MAIQVARPVKEREGAFLRKLLHEAADELADMYECGDPLWLHKFVGLCSTEHGDLKIDIFVKDWS